MSQSISEIEIIYWVSTFILIIITSGIIALVYQYRKNKIEFVEEKKSIHMKHRTQLQEATLEMQQLTMQDIGREIHDGVGQRLTLASIYTKQLLGKSATAELNQKAEEINIIINESLRQLRSLSKELTDEKNHEVDLSKLINDEVKKIADLNICHIHFENKSEFYLKNKKAMFIIRILQEFLQNSLKYAECKNIYLQLQQIDNEVRIDIRDDGNGFDTSAVSKGIGLQNIKRRAEMIDASLLLDSSIGEGTSLNLKLNLH